MLSWYFLGINPNSSPTNSLTSQLSHFIIPTNKFSRHNSVFYFLFLLNLIANTKPIFLKSHHNSYHFTGLFFIVIIQLIPVRAHLYVLSERCAKTDIDLRRFFISILKNRCCSTDIKINTALKKLTQNELAFFNFLSKHLFKIRMPLFLILRGYFKEVRVFYIVLYLNSYISS